MFTETATLSTELSTRITQKRSIFAIIVHFGSHGVTERAVQSLQEGSFPVKDCIVVDHGDTHNSLVNKGYAAGLAAGIKQAGIRGAAPHDLILLLNNDAQIQKEGVKRLMEWWDLAGSAHTLAGSVWGSVSLITGRATITGEKIPKGFFRIPYVHGSCMALQYALASSLHIPTEFFMYWEDVAMSIQASRQGVSLARIPFSFVVHDDKPAPLSDEKLYYLVRNGAYVLEHDLPSPWNSWWYAVNTGRRLFHSNIPSAPHAIIAKALVDARIHHLGKAVI